MGLLKDSLGEGNAVLSPERQLVDSEWLPAASRCWEIACHPEELGGKKTERGNYGFISDETREGVSWHV